MNAECEDMITSPSFSSPLEECQRKSVKRAFEDETHKSIPFAKAFGTFTRVLIWKAHETSAEKKNEVASSFVRDLFNSLPFGNKIQFGGRTVYLDPALFDSYAEVYASHGWKTNLQRMEEGFAPIGHKGIVKKGERTQNIEKIQNSYRMHLHHVTQRESGPDEHPDDNPLIVIPHILHKGGRNHYVLEKKSPTKRTEIVHENLEKKEAHDLLELGQTVIGDPLHVFEGDKPKVRSKINREAFNKWRPEFWKYCAAKIKADELKAEAPVKKKIKLDIASPVKKKLDFDNLPNVGNVTKKLSENFDAVYDKENMGWTFTPNIGE